MASFIDLMLSCSDIARQTGMSYSHSDRTDTQKGLHMFIEHLWLHCAQNSKCKLSLHALLPPGVDIKIPWILFSVAVNFL